MMIFQLSVFWYIAGRLVFLLAADFTLEAWNDIYYIWDAAKDLLFVWALRNLVTVQYRWIIKPVFYYCIIRLLWEIINPFTNLEINHPEAITASFMVIAIGVSLLLLKDLILRWKQKQ